MEQNKENVTEVQENTVEDKKEATWDSLAMEVAGKLKAAEKAKNAGLFVLGAVAAIAIIFGFAERQHLVNANLQNDREWRELFSSYDYVSQDGEGQNYYNNEIGGNVNNGAENKETER